jgi:hypothetical protein
LKKTVVFLLVAAMIVGPLVAVFVYLGMDDNGDEDLFSDIPQPVIRSNRFVDLRGLDVPLADFTGDGGIFHTFSFDTATQWPDDENLPEPGLPGKLLEQGKYLGLGLNALRERGITGQGVTVAVIDKPLLQEHQAFGSRMKYIEVGPAGSGTDRLSFHGAHVAGLLAGTDGVAPDAILYYFAVHESESPYFQYAEAINKMLELQQELPEQDKIRVAAVAQGVENPRISEGAPELFEAIAKARQQGIIVIYPGMSSLPVTGAGCPPHLDRDNPGNYEVWSWTRAKRDIAGKLKARSASSWEDAVYMLKQMLVYEESLDSLLAAAIETFLGVAYTYRDYVDFHDWLAMVLDETEEALAVPVDCITVPNSNGENEYTYYGSGGLSWSIGYIAGMATLGVQVKPDVTEQEMVKLLWDTATPFQWSLRLANPAGFIERLASP